MNEEYRRLIHRAAVKESALIKEKKYYPVGVGVVDTGIYPHMDLKASITEFFDCIGGRQGVYDNNGHGSHIAGIIAGSGIASGGKYRGANTGARLVVVKGLDEKGGGMVSQVVQGIEYLMRHRERLNIRVINISMGGGAQEEYEKYRPLLSAVEEAWNIGITVCVAAGNSGPMKGSVTIPGTSKKVITVGAGDDYIPVRMRGKTLVHYSGKGPTMECIVKPDILCPGTNIMSCKNNRNGYAAKSGTSMSTAVVSGMVSLLLSEHPDMTPKDVKKTIMDKGII